MKLFRIEHIFPVGWSEWSHCSEKCNTGERSRSRTVTVEPRFGGAGCPILSDKDGCGAHNGGCDDQCRPEDGSCVCTRTGYELQGNM